MYQAPCTWVLQCAHSGPAFAARMTIRRTRRIAQTYRLPCVEEQGNAARASAPTDTAFWADPRDGSGYCTMLTATTWPSVQEMSTSVYVNAVLELSTGKRSVTSSSRRTDSAAPGTGFENASSSSRLRSGNQSVPRPGRPSRWRSDRDGSRPRRHIRSGRPSYPPTTPPPASRQFRHQLNLEQPPTRRVRAP